MRSARQQAEMAARREGWTGIVARAEASGLSIRRFCAKFDVEEGQFYYWRKRLQLEATESQGPSSAEPGFVLVRAQRAPAEAEAKVLELIVERGWRLRIPRGVEPTTLRVVLDALVRQQA
jgi:transposase-like protein